MFSDVINIFSSMHQKPLKDEEVMYDKFYVRTTLPIFSESALVEKLAC